MKRVKELEREYLRQLERCKDAESKIELASQKEQKLRLKLKELALSDGTADK